MNGEGTMMYKDGSNYTGTWTFGERQGFGTMLFKNSTGYTGNSLILI